MLERKRTKINGIYHVVFENSNINIIAKYGEIKTIF